MKKYVINYNYPLEYRGTYVVCAEDSFKASEKVENFLIEKYGERQNSNTIVMEVIDGKIQPIGGYKWVAYSNDKSFEDKSNVVFDNKKDCYNSMRDAVLSKMKWNTQYNEDFPYDGDAVGYSVRFAKDMIVHTSFSGCYVYKIVSEFENPSYEDIFTDELIKELTELGLYDF